jgi:GrpB-like predicted nucleotidyltransferase (UPF0157 family)
MTSIEISEYDPSWADHFRALHDKLWPSISDIALAIEHVGSTSVVGLAAKPVLDITIVVSSRSNMKLLTQKLEALGLEHRGDLGIPGREAFTRFPGFFPHNLYASIEGGQGLRNHIAVRDYLRSNPASILEYSRLKKSLASKFPNDIDAYVEGKSLFLLDILKKSGFTDSELSEIEQSNKKA